MAHVTILWVQSTSSWRIMQKLFDCSDLHEIINYIWHTVTVLAYWIKLIIARWLPTEHLKVRIQKPYSWVQLAAFCLFFYDSTISHSSSSVFVMHLNTNQKNNTSYFLIKKLHYYTPTRSSLYIPFSPCLVSLSLHLRPKLLMFHFILFTKQLMNLL
jgi:hypothetical protein